MFLGKSTHTLDAKGRLMLPAKFKKAINKPIFLRIALSGEYLEIILESTQKQIQEQLNSFNEFNLQAQEMKALLNSQTYEIKIDNAGRINIPQEILVEMKINKEVVVSGNGDRIIIWPLITFETKITNNRPAMILQMKALANELSGTLDGKK